MAKLTIKGLDKYITDLSAISNMTDDEIGKCIFPAAQIVADAARAAVIAMREDISKALGRDR